MRSTAIVRFFTKGRIFRTALSTNEATTIDVSTTKRIVVNLINAKQSAVNNITRRIVPFDIEIVRFF